MRNLKGLEGRACTGNALADVAEQAARGQKGPSWFIGHFQPEGDPRKTTAFEVAITEAKKGWQRGKWGGQYTATTFSYVVSGKIRVDFFRESVELGPGDYVYYGPEIIHNVEALEDAVWLSCRGPSLVADSYNVSDPAGGLG